MNENKISFYARTSENKAKRILTHFQKIQSIKNTVGSFHVFRIRSCNTISFDPAPHFALYTYILMFR